MLEQLKKFRIIFIIAQKLFGHAKVRCVSKIVLQKDVLKVKRVKPEVIRHYWELIEDTLDYREQG